MAAQDAQDWTNTQVNAGLVYLGTVSQSAGSTGTQTFTVPPYTRAIIVSLRTALGTEQCGCSVSAHGGAQFTYNGLVCPEVTPLALPPSVIAYCNSDLSLVWDVTIGGVKTLTDHTADVYADSEWPVVSVAGLVQVTGPSNLSGALVTQPAITDTLSVLGSSVRNASTASQEYQTPGYTGLILRLDVASAPGVQTIQASIQYKATAAGAWAAIHSALSTVNAAGITYYLIKAGTTAADWSPGFANIRNIALPVSWRVFITHSGAGSWTYSANVCLIP
jgi:hypothetical protein